MDSACRTNIINLAEAVDSDPLNEHLKTLAREALPPGSPPLLDVWTWD